MTWEDILKNINFNPKDRKKLCCEEARLDMLRAFHDHHISIGGDTDTRLTTFYNFIVDGIDTATCRDLKINLRDFIGEGADDREGSAGNLIKILKQILKEWITCEGKSYVV